MSSPTNADAGAFGLSSFHPLHTALFSGMLAYLVSSPGKPSISSDSCVEQPYFLLHRSFQYFENSRNTMLLLLYQNSRNTQVKLLKFCDHFPGSCYSSGGPSEKVVLHCERFCHPERSEGSRKFFRKVDGILRRFAPQNDKKREHLNRVTGSFTLL